MHGLQCVAGDVCNAYLPSYTIEKLYIVVGKEFGPYLEGKRLIVRKSAYGSRSAAARFHECLSAKLRRIHSHPSNAMFPLPNAYFRSINSQRIATFPTNLYPLVYVHPLPHHNQQNPLRLFYSSVAMPICLWHSLVMICYECLRIWLWDYCDDLTDYLVPGRNTHISHPTCLLLYTASYSDFLICLI